MKLSPYPQETREKFTQKYWYDFFHSKYQFQGVPEKYFEYIDAKYFVEMSEQEWGGFSQAVESVNQVFLKAYGFYLENLEKNLPDFMPFHRIIRDALPLNEYAIGRYDILVDKTGEFRFLETNANTPGMTVESHYPASELCPEGCRNISENLIKHLQDWVLKHSPKGKTLGIFTAYSFENEDYITCRDLADIFSQVKSVDEIVVGDVFELDIVDGYPYLKGKPVDTIYSYFPFEFFLTDPAYALDFFEILGKHQIPYSNPFESMILQDKLIFPVVWENFERFTPEEQQVIRRYIPFSTREFQEDSTKFIAKWRFGRYGREIYTEDFYTNIAMPERYIYQEKVDYRTEDEFGSFLVLGGYTDYKKCLSAIARKQEFGTTDDTYNMVTLVFVRYT